VQIFSWFIVKHRTVSIHAYVSEYVMNIEYAICKLRHLYSAIYLLKSTMGTQNGRLRAKPHDKILKVQNSAVCESS